MPKMDPMLTEQSMFEDPSSGSYTQTYLPCGEVAHEIVSSTSSLTITVHRPERSSPRLNTSCATRSNFICSSPCTFSVPALPASFASPSLRTQLAMYLHDVPMLWIKIDRSDVSSSLAVLMMNVPSVCRSFTSTSNASSSWFRLDFRVNPAGVSPSDAIAMSARRASALDPKPLRTRSHRKRDDLRGRDGTGTSRDRETKRARQCRKPTNSTTELLPKPTASSRRSLSRQRSPIGRLFALRFLTPRSTVRRTEEIQGLILE